MRRGDGKFIPYKRITINHYKMDVKDMKLTEHHNCFKQDPPIDAKISEQSFEEKKDICIKVSLLRFLFTVRKK